MKQIRTLIITEARRLGFALAGFTTPEPAAHLGVLEDWLSKGYHGSMAYLGDPRRSDPRLLLEECRSILMLGMRYASVELARDVRVAAYAGGRDYHIVMQERMQALGEVLERELGQAVRWRAYSDSAPLLERELAQRAGLGWIGRNTCLIHPEIGSYFLLAEMLLDIEIEANAPFSGDRCGTCRRCVEACPTGALLGDRTMDARRCISYLTIENKGAIPPDLRARVGDWVFGCDLCQMACPWNRKADGAGESALATRPEMLELEASRELKLSKQEFKSKFADSPILRARRGGYLRNFAVVLGNRGSAASMPALEQALEDEDALVREHAAWALEQIRGGR